MPNDDAPDVVVDLEDLLLGMTRSLAEASGQLPVVMEEVEGLRSQPFRYHIPKMTVTIRLSFTYKNKKVKGVIRKRHASKTQEVESTVEFDIVAVPKEPDSGGVPY
jgi:hypothetical protein